jgi:hypothetical protein
MIVAHLLRLEATVARGHGTRTAGGDLADDSRRVAPALLDLVGIGADDLNVHARIDPSQDMDAVYARLGKAIPLLIGTLQTDGPCDTSVLAATVLAVVRPLRWALAMSHATFAVDGGLAVRFADRLWERRAAGPVRIARTVLDALSLVVCTTLWLMMMPVARVSGLLYGAADRLSDRTAPEDGAGRIRAGPSTDDVAALRSALDAGTITRLDRARSAMADHVALAPADADAARRIEAHLGDLCHRFARADLAGPLEEGTAARVAEAVSALSESMEAMARSTSRKAAQDLDTEIRFVLSAHGRPPVDALSA